MDAEYSWFLFLTNVSDGKGKEDLISYYILQVHLSWYRVPGRETCPVIRVKNSRAVEIGDKMRIAVIDGQGGGIGRLITEQIRKHLPTNTEIIAFGTNVIATSLMLKAGANEGATGENAVIQNVDDVDVIVGPLGIILAHSMRGELTANMAEAIAKSKAHKILLPLTLSRVEVIGVQVEPLPHQVEKMINRLKEMMEVKTDV